jgi:hypothetical protein
MKRLCITLVSGLVLAVAAYCGFYYCGTAQSRDLVRNERPELGWLKQEFQLGDAEFARIADMHKAYLAGCAERCRLIDEKNEHLRELLSATNTITPEIDRALSEAALLRAECQKKMLQHFYEVSRTMPPEQGQRYLAWVQDQTIVSDSHQAMHH